MTVFGDNIYTGSLAATSAASSLGSCRFSKTFTFATTGGTTAITRTGTFPIGTTQIDAKLFIIANGSATVSDKITVSAGGVNLITIGSFGSASGVLRSTTTGLGTITTLASAVCPLAAAAAAEVSYSVTYLPASASNGVSTNLEIMFNRVDTNFG